MINVAIAGINGKMGRASARAISADPELRLVGAFGPKAAAYVGKDIGALALMPSTGILITNGLLDVIAGQKPDVVLDFTRAEVAVTTARTALEHGIRPVIGTSGIGEKETRELFELAVKQRIGGMIVPNFSLGAVLMMEFAKQAAEHYANVEVVEMHGPKKVDAPSGTAMHTLNKLGKVGKKYNPPLVDEHELVQGSRGGKSESGVRVHSLRLPGLISSQEVIFGAEGELLTIRHDSFSTDCFMPGIIMAIKAVMSMQGLVVGLEHLLNPEAVPV